MVKVTADQKRALAYNARMSNKSWEDATEISGYGSVESCMNAVRIYIEAHPAPGRDEHQAKKIYKHAKNDAILQRIIDKGEPIKTTSIGKVVYDPRNCTCGVRGDHKQLHDEDCPAEPVTDSQPVVAAIKAQNDNDADLEKFLGWDKPEVPDESEEYASQLAWAQGLANTNRLQAAELERLELDNAALRATIERWESSGIMPAQIMP
jgi:hypothetical protein